MSPDRQAHETIDLGGATEVAIGARMSPYLTRVSSRF